MMRVWTKAVWQWVNGVLVELPEEGESYWYDGPVALAGSGTPVSRITHYRGRSDTDTVDATPTWIAAEDTAFSVTVGTNFRIRIGVENTGTAEDTVLNPQTGTNTGIGRCGYSTLAYTALTNVINGADAGASADATVIAVQRLTSGAGSFDNTRAGYDESEGLSITCTAGSFVETETGLVLTGGTSTVGVGGGETWTKYHAGLTNAPLNIPTFTTPETNGSDFEHGNQLGGAAQKVANSATISMTTEAHIRANNLCVVVVCCDNNGTTDADHSEISGVTIGGVSATKAREFTNGQGAAQGGITTSVWWLQHSSQIDSGSTITATFTTNTTSGDANTIQAREFVVASGKTVAVEATNAQATDGASQPSSIDAATSNIECLRVAAHGGETAQSAAQAPQQTRASNSTWSFWWTSGALCRSTTIASHSASDITSFVEAKISTGTGAASQIGTLATGCDWSSCYVAFRADGAGGGQPIVKRAGGVEFMHSLGRFAGKHIKMWFQGLLWGDRAWPKLQV